MTPDKDGLWWRVTEPRPGVLRRCGMLVLHVGTPEATATDLRDAVAIPLAWLTGGWWIWEGKDDGARAPMWNRGGVE